MVRTPFALWWDGVSASFETPAFISIRMIENWFGKNSFLNIFKISGDLTKCEDRVPGPRKRECLSLKKPNKKTCFFVVLNLENEEGFCVWWLVLEGFVCLFLMICFNQIFV